MDEKRAKIIEKMEKPVPFHLYKDLCLKQKLIGCLSVANTIVIIILHVTGL